MSNKNLTYGLIVVGIIAIIGVFTPIGQNLIKSFGGVTNYDEVDATALKIGGSNGSRLGPIISGQASLTNIQAGNTTASTTAAFDIAVTGVVSGDTVFAQFATTTAITVGGSNWTILGAKASTTAGFITVIVRNDTGTAANISATGIASTTNYLVLHPVSTVPGL